MKLLKVYYFCSLVTSLKYNITEKLNKILIIRLSSIGDIILTTPLIRVLRNAYPRAQIDFVIKKEFSQLLSHCPHLNTLYKYDKEKNNLKDIKQQVRSEKYDLILDIHKNFRSKAITSFSLAKKVTSYKKYIFRRTLLVEFNRNLYSEIIPVYLRYFQSVKHLHINYDGNGTEISHSSANNKEAKDLIESVYTSNISYIVICPGAAHATKRWKIEGYAETADYFVAKGMSIILHGGADDIDLCHAVRDKMKHKAEVFAGKLSLQGSAVLLKEAKLVITNDTGMLHLAQSQKTPVVGIFGSTTKELGYFPLPEKSAVVEHEVPCRPCSHNGKKQCPKGHFDCMMKIDAKKVIFAAEKLLNN